MPVDSTESVFTAHACSLLLLPLSSQVLKGSSISVWIRNIELALIGIFVGLIGVYYADKEMVTELGFFYGYSPVVWGAICLQVSTFATIASNASVYIT